MILYLISVISGVLIIMVLHEMCSSAFICLVLVVGGFSHPYLLSFFFFEKKLEGKGFTYIMIYKERKKESKLWQNRQ